jgi:predicted O-linked N-acetylglucosamine transferase (SPINDLY family)
MGGSVASRAPAVRPAAGRKLRIGYLSSDLYNHATAWLMAEIVELHDRSRFESIAYSYGLKVEDETRQRLRRGFDQFRDISGMLDHEAAERIREDQVDILVDLKGLYAKCAVRSPGVPTGTRADQLSRFPGHHGRRIRGLHHRRRRRHPAEP